MIEEKLEQLKNEKDKFVSELKNWSSDQLSWAENDEWNALKILEHVITSEHGTLAYLKKKTQAAAEDIPVAGDLQNARELNEALISDKKWKAPEVLPVPQGNSTLDEQAQYWEILRMKVNVFFKGLDASYHNRLIFNHPLAGRLDTEQTLEFMINHIVHHGHQIKRLKARLESLQD